MPLRSFSNPDPVTASLVGSRPTQGEYVPDRDFWNTAAAGPANSGYVAFSFWTADKTESINSVRVTTGGTAAAATPTLCRMGIYSVNAAGDLTALLAATVNDTSLFSVANTPYSKALSTTFGKVAGQRYATALLVVTAAAMPNFVGVTTTPGATANHWLPIFELPTLASRVLGQTDLAASYTRAQQGASTPYRVAFTLT